MEKGLKLSWKLPLYKSVDTPTFFMKYFFLPDPETLLLSDFASMPQQNFRINRTVSALRLHSKKGVVWEPEKGFLGSAGIKLITDKKNPSSLEWVLQNLQSYSFLEFRGKMCTENIINGPKKKNSARFLVYFRDNKGKGLWDYPHIAGSLSGTSPWKEFIKYFPVPDSAATAHVVIQNNSKSGTMWCDDISLRPAHINTGYFLYKNIFIVLSIAFGTVLITSFRLWENRGWIPLAIVAIILVGILCSHNSMKIIAENINTKIYVVKKFGHLFLFFILGIVTTSWLGSRLKSLGNISLSLPYPFYVFGGLLLFAAITEFFQLVTIDRGPSIFDLLIDMTGIIAGISVACFVKTKVL